MSNLDARCARDELEATELGRPSKRRLQSLAASIRLNTFDQEMTLRVIT